MRVAGRSLALCAVVVSVGCVGSPNSPSEIAVPAASTARGSTVTTQTLDGSFRIKPAPDANGVIVLDSGEKLIVNANDDLRANPNATLHLIVNWGDGPNARIGCGPCRLEHAYTKPGRYEAEATIDDGLPAGQASAATTVSRRFRVEVRAADTFARLVATPGRILPGGSTTLSWETVGATSRTIDNGIGGVPAEGSVSVSPAATTTYTLTASGPAGTTTSRVTVIVSNFTTFSVSPNPVSAGQIAVWEFEAPGGWSSGSISGGCTIDGFVVFTPTHLILNLGTPGAPATCTLSATAGASTESVTLVVQ